MDGFRNFVTKITYYTTYSPTGRNPEELCLKIAVAKQCLRLIRSIIAGMIRLLNDEHLNASAVGYHPAGISHLDAKRIAVEKQTVQACQDKLDQLRFFPRRKMVLGFCHTTNSLCHFFLTCSPQP
ncbi:hypothetical protein CEXT_545531 [Caerostris extrusa]|uniref:Uncharacterized protein n=1 Tax=Caerostris extrusa TaxID=172846 RepID=A0AAV4NE89_CAEEX|nr:hypothetical protein CEXT_545531 [Caerostris extrusa]